MEQLTPLNTSQLPEKQQHELNELQNRIQSLKEAIEYAECTEDYDYVITQALSAANENFNNNLGFLSNENLQNFLAEKFEQVTKTFFDDHSKHNLHRRCREEVTNLQSIHEEKRLNLENTLRLLRKYSSAFVSDSTLIQYINVLSVGLFSDFIDILNDKEIDHTSQMVRQFSYKLKSKIKALKESESRRSNLDKKSIKYEYLLQMVDKKFNMDIFRTYFNTDSEEQVSDLKELIKSQKSESILSLLESDPTTDEIKRNMEKWNEIIERFRGQLRDVGNLIEMYSERVRTERQGLTKLENEMENLTRSAPFLESRVSKAKREKEKEALKKSIEDRNKKILYDERYKKIDTSIHDMIIKKLLLCEKIVSSLDIKLKEVNGNSTDSSSSNSTQSPESQNASRRKHDCSICFEEVESSSALALPCSHTFHSLCIRKWLERKNKCPLCLTTATLT